MRQTVLQLAVPFSSRITLMQERMSPTLASWPLWPSAAPTGTIEMTTSTVAPALFSPPFLLTIVSTDQVYPTF